MADKNEKKTLEEMLEANAAAIMDDAEARAAASASMDAENQESLKMIKELQDKISRNNRKIGRNKKYVKYLAEKKLFAKVVEALGLKNEEAKCKTPAEYDSLINDVLKRIKELKEAEEKLNPVEAVVPEKNDYSDPEDPEDSEEINSSDPEDSVDPEEN